MSCTRTTGRLCAVVVLAATVACGQSTAGPSTNKDATPSEPTVEPAAIDGRAGDIKPDLGMAPETNDAREGNRDMRVDSSLRDAGGADTDDPFVNGGALPEQPTHADGGGACGPYGINCTYGTADGTHHCTCLNSSPREARAGPAAELLGIQAVLAAAEVPKGSFYHHFKTKEDFALQVIDTYMVEVHKGLDACLGDSSRPPLKRVRRFFEATRASYKKGGLPRLSPRGDWGRVVGG